MSHASLPAPLARFCVAAAPSAAVWRLLGGVLTILAMLVALGVAIGALSLWRDAPFDTAKAFALFETPVSALILLATFLFWRPALWLALRLFHKRRLHSVFGADGRVNWREFGRGFGIASAFAVMTGLLGWAVVGAPVQTIQPAGAANWAIFALIALPLIYFQTSAEEMVFRGYFLQQLAARKPTFWAWAVAPSVVFGLLHWNPEGYGALVWMTLFITGVMGLIFALVTATTGNLGLAMGMHFGFNVYALLLVAPNSNFAALALAHWPESPSDAAALTVVEVSALLMLACAAIWAYRRNGAA